jgi:hypothetical protein
VNDLKWAFVDAPLDGETYSHISIWDDPTAGNCLWTGALGAPVPMEAGNVFTIPAGSLVAALD